MNDAKELALIALAALGLTLAFFFLIRISWNRNPIQNALRGLLALLAALIAYLGLPTVKGQVRVDMDWGWLLKVQGANLSIGETRWDILVAILVIGALLVYCLARLK